MQHRVFNLDRRVKGVSPVLAGAVDLADAVEHTGIANLDVLTCGPPVPNPADVLNSERFAQMIARTAEQYERVILDSPPVVTVTDSLILAALCDVTVLVLRAEKSMRRISMQARDTLAGVDARLLGVVVNDVPHKSHRYGYYGGYGCYGHRHGSNGGNGHLKKKRDAVLRNLSLADDGAEPDPDRLRPRPFSSIVSAPTTTSTREERMDETTS